VIAEIAIHEVQERRYAAAICTGGWAPLSLRADGKMRTVLAEFVRSGKTVGAICNGAWMVISAGVCRGLKMTGPPALKDDLVNAGAIVHDAPVVVDRNLVTGRNTCDLPQFMKAVLESIAKTEHAVHAGDKVAV